MDVQRSRSPRSWRHSWSRSCGSDDEGPEPNEGTAIVSIGDSVASGEGNPARQGPDWEERRCHRSAAAGQSLAGRQAASENPGLVFHSFACSGATIDRGLLGPYRGIEPALFQEPAPPQVERVAAVKAVTEGGIAALLVSVGANDIGFVKIVKFCVTVPNCPTAALRSEVPADRGRQAEAFTGAVGDGPDRRASRRLREARHRAWAAASRGSGGDRRVLRSDDRGRRHRLHDPRRGIARRVAVGARAGPPAAQRAGRGRRR